MIKIVDNKLVGKYTTRSQFGANTPWCNKFPVSCDFTGADINEVCRRAYDAAVIVARQRVGTEADANKLAAGVKFMDMVQAKRTVTLEEVADTATEEEAKALMERLAAKFNLRVDGDNTGHVQ